MAVTTLDSIRIYYVYFGLSVSDKLNINAKVDSSIFVQYSNGKRKMPRGVAMARLTLGYIRMGTGRTPN